MNKRDVHRQELEALLQVRDMRSADRANIRTMLKAIKKGQDLGYQEVMNLWAYCNRYDVPAINVLRG